MAAIWIIVSATFDFFDGLVARLLHVSSPIGKELDSLADVVSFGVAPAMITYTWLNRCLDQIPPIYQNTFTELLPLVALIVPALSAVRLAKFNLDERQHNNFIGMPTPANALFLAFIPATAERINFLNNFWIVWFLMIALAILLVSPIHMLSLKFKNLKFQGENIPRFILLLSGLIMLIFFREGAFPLIMLTYLFISLVYHSYRLFSPEGEIEKNEE